VDEEWISTLQGFLFHIRMSVPIGSSDPRTPSGFDWVYTTAVYTQGGRMHFKHQLTNNNNNNNNNNKEEIKQTNKLAMINSMKRTHS
jgi:hypothetical protein